MTSPDYLVDVGACSSVAVCRHCDARMVRAEQALVVAEVRSHIVAAHRDDRRALERVQTAIRRDRP